MSEPAAAAPYRVLARKYRPTDFSTLIGQEALVRTLTNAFRTGRLAHAYLLTGVRGVGKTTTARIIARALNCIGPDGSGGPTSEPCGVCPHCRSILEDRDVDVMEMDAASRTGIADIREILDGVGYRPVSARYKVYIIDEVHQLSTSAFNALLKTLEEPPPHVKFVFATTELRKVPPTVLSRCQRFDLRRVEGAVLEKHFAWISEKEGVAVEPGALALLARAADGSVRDGLSLLDQAIAHAGNKVTEADLREMLGLADRAAIFDLFEAVMKGDIPQALDLLGQQYALGIDPATVISDLLELTHWLTRLKLVPALAKDPGMPETERVRGATLSQSLALAGLTRAWQMLLKGLGELRGAPSPLQAAEMVLVRLAYAADLPSPAEAIEALRDAPQSAPAMPSGGGAPRITSGGGSSGAASAVARSAQSLPAPAPVPGQPIASAVPQDFKALVELCVTKREAVLSTHLKNDVHLVDYEPGRIELRLGENAPSGLAPRLSGLLNEWTGRSWLVTISNEPGAASLRDQKIDADRREREAAAEHPLVKAMLATFPGAVIETVRELAAPEPEETADDPVSEAAFVPEELREPGLDLDSGDDE